MAQIEVYLKDELDLILHPNKRHLQNINKGVAFLGAVVYPYRTHPGKRLKTNLKKALEDLGCSHGTEDSYRGLVLYYRHFRLLNYKVDCINRLHFTGGGEVEELVYNEKGILLRPCR